MDRKKHARLCVAVEREYKKKRIYLFFNSFNFASGLIFCFVLFVSLGDDAFSTLGSLIFSIALYASLIFSYSLTFSVSVLCYCRVPESYTFLLSFLFFFFYSRSLFGMFGHVFHFARRSKFIKWFRQILFCTRAS